jgi:hypothetical protein
MFDPNGFFSFFLRFAYGDIINSANAFAFFGPSIPFPFFEIHFFILFFEAFVPAQKMFSSSNPKDDFLYICFLRVYLFIIMRYG